MVGSFVKKLLAPLLLSSAVNYCAVVLAKEPDIGCGLPDVPVYTEEYLAPKIAGCELFYSHDNQSNIDQLGILDCNKRYASNSRFEKACVDNAKFVYLDRCISEKFGQDICDSMNDLSHVLEFCKRTSENNVGGCVKEIKRHYGQFCPEEPGTLSSYLASQFPDQPVIVHLWGMSCAPCVDELPEINALSEKVPVVGIYKVFDSLSRGFGQIQLAQSRYTIAFPNVLFDEDGFDDFKAALNEADVRAAMPSFWVVKSGKCVHLEQGALDKNGRKLDLLLNAAK